MKSSWVLLDINIREAKRLCKVLAASICWKILLVLSVSSKYSVPSHFRVNCKLDFETDKVKFYWGTETSVDGNFHL